MIREVVLNDEAPFTPLLIERARGTLLHGLVPRAGRTGPIFACVTR